MYSLLIDTHNIDIRLVLYKNESVLDTVIKESSRSHSIYLMPMIIELLEKNNISKKDIANIFVVNGPGSFTGVRIGVTVAKTWAFVNKITIKSISSLELLTCSENFDPNKLVAIKDNKGYYIGDFKSDKKLYYINKNEKNDDELLFEEDITVDYKLVYEYLKKLPSLNPHEVNPLYIKKIGIGND